ncbi:hypothetical protein E2986_11374 [Frieseomelitta varia]|uniref:Cytochrome b5 domain-containing protein 1 n=1 Tax=Frieseomelitta varia TaxID=561572 RepID=A0A833RHE8_9HYME|nr:hypothetical protein E2986_11374 [Frieseomelitta varia]
MSSVHQCFLSAERNSYEINKYVADDVPRKVEYFLPTEVAVHNTEIDCWISYNDMVYDLTDLCKIWANKREIKPILAYAGKDISHWFDHEKNDIKYYVHPVTGVLVPYCPHGPIPDVISSVVPCSTWRPLDKCPWWLDDKWKFEGKDLTLDLTLTENGIPDERERFAACGLPDDYYIPCLIFLWYPPFKLNENTKDGTTATVSQHDLANFRFEKRKPYFVWKILVKLNDNVSICDNSHIAKFSIAYLPSREISLSSYYKEYFSNY